MLWVKSMKGKEKGIEIVLGDDVTIRLTKAIIDKIKGMKLKHKGKDLFYVDYHVYDKTSIGFCLSDMPIPDNWWVPDFE